MPLPLIALPLYAKILLGTAAAATAAGASQAQYTKNANKEAIYDAVGSFRDKTNSKYVDSLSDAELRGLLDQYRYVDNDWTNLGGLLGDKEVIDVESALQDLARLEQFKDQAPVAPDLNLIYDEAQKQIDAENAEILKMYDDDNDRQKELYNNLMSQNNAAYNRNVGQIMSNDYQKNAQLMGTVRSEMQRSQRNALESGASAGMRIAENINTTLSLQNRQSQQSLETSNNLAQMLLNQQQANAGLRSEYGNYLSQDANRRASLKSGTAERVANQFGNRADIADRTYNQQLQNYDSAYASASGTFNPFADSYRVNLQKSQYSNN